MDTNITRQEFDSMSDEEFNAWYKKLDGPPRGKLAVMTQTICQSCMGTGRIRDEKAFGAEMQAKRLAAKMTLRTVSQRMELSISYVSDLEHGRKRWRGGLIIAYVDALGQNGEIHA